jgi:hypothetical protein
MALWLVNVVPEAASTVDRRLVVAKGREGIARRRRMRRQSSVFELHPLRQATIWRGGDGALSSTTEYLIGLGLSKVKCTALYGRVLNVGFTPLKNSYAKCLR